MKFINPLLILTTFLLAGFLFLYKLDSIPNGFYVDEALPGYNAYSIISTGKDEFGKFLPLSFRFYGLYNPPLHVYLISAPIYIFGLKVWSVRLVSAISGILSVFVLYLLLVHSGFVKKKVSILIITLTTVITPWLLFQSRTGYEVVLAFLFFEAGVIFSWLSLKNIKLILPAFTFLSLSIYTAYSERFLVPIFLIGFLCLFRKELFMKKNISFVIFSILFLIITQIPNLFLFFTNSFFPKSNLLPLGSLSGQASKILLLPRFISFALAFVREFLSQYLTYFSPRSLFFLPDPDLQRSIPELSVFYNWMIIPYLLGLITLWRRSSNNFIRLIIFLLLISPIPASLTKDPFATHRAMPLLLPMLLVIGLGIDKLVDVIGKRLTILVYSFVFVFSLVLLWRSYFILMPHERAKNWGYGYNQLADFIKNNPGKKFLIDQSRSKPHYIELAFFLKYPPSDLQKSVDQSIKDLYYQNPPFNPDYKFANIETRSIDWKKDAYFDEVIVGDELSVSDSQIKEHFLTKVLEIRNPMNEIAFVGYETNAKKKCMTTNYASVYCKK
ncbi:glycosyltransferase family 39 protein [Candidatus Woesebacteria bacterium]|nr:glycosyltransferase family 39 protein [Candidatus Woesebacteria bacterium]